MNTPKNSELSDGEMTADEALQILKELTVTQPLIVITRLGRAILCGIKALEERKEVNMKAKDTVMLRVNIFRGSTPKPIEQIEKLLEAQAEITWKARDKEVEEAYEKGFADAKDIATQQAYEAGIDSGRKNGRGETVKFVDDNSHIQSTLGDWARIIPDEKWQAFKKKEGE